LWRESLTRIAQEAERAAGAMVGQVGTPDTGLSPAGRASPLTRHLSKTVLGLGMVGIVGFIPVQKLLPTSGIEAVINAHVITLSAPIDGEVPTSSGLPEIGTPFARPWRSEPPRQLGKLSFQSSRQSGRSGSEDRRIRNHGRHA
jgi:hypothetical protein